MTPQLRYPKMRVFYTKIYPHDFIWFASFDVGAVSTTEPVIHNFALSYAISNFNRILVNSSIPDYEKDLEAMDWYACPSRVKYFARTSLMWNAIDTKTQTTEDPFFEKANTPKFGKRHVLAPWPATLFETYIFSKSGQKPPRVIRIGKKRAPCVLESEEIAINELQVIKSIKPTHIVNPLDLTGALISYRVITIVPSLLAEEALIENGVVIRDHKHSILVPKRLLEG